MPSGSAAVPGGDSVKGALLAVERLEASDAPARRHLSRRDPEPAPESPSRTRAGAHGRAHALHVIATVTPTEVAATDEFDARRVWLGPDDRQVVALVLPAELLVIHVMPTVLRRKP